MNTPKAQEVYRHFKGNCYQILAVAEHTESGDQLVVYQAMYGEHKIYARPLDMFMSPVDKAKYPDADQDMRFERIKQSDEVEEDSEYDPGLARFLSAETYEKRLEVLDSLKKSITDDTLTSMSIACDVTLPNGSIEEKYETLKKALIMFDKFEGNRLRS